MKTEQTKSKKPTRSVNRKGPVVAVNSGRPGPGNRWPSDKEIQQVSQRLARISRKGMQRENAGDYFKSGDLAYQVREIIRNTDDLFKQIKRIKS